MRLNKFVNINSHYTRSVNLERDVNQLDSINSYIPTSRSIGTIEKLCSKLEETKGQTPRSWSLIGPYGSGKSSAAIYLSSLLSEKNSEHRNAAFKSLSSVNEGLADKLNKAVKIDNGFLKIVLTGSPERLGKKITESIAVALDEFVVATGATCNELIDYVKLVAAQKIVTSTDTIRVIERLQKELQGQAAGILLVVDEFGKFLEFEARSFDANEIYLLQMLAEHACESNSVNLFIFVLLHQAFDQYAKGLGGNLKKEWSKIQGRFEEVNFVDTTEQTLKIVGTAIDKKIPKAEAMVIENKIQKICSSLKEAGALPATFNVEDTTKLFYACYPLHPVTALILPQLTQKIAQNERTLFSYLGSSESFGLKAMLDRLEVGEWVYPADVYNYFIENQANIHADHLTSKRWVEVISALERVIPSTEKDIFVLKAIGLLNIAGSRAGFKASDELLLTLDSSKDLISTAIRSLINQSIVTFRKYNNEYRVWQGSDFDLDDAIEKEIDSFGQFSLVDELNASASLMPLIARRYTIEVGAIRYFTPCFIDAVSYKTVPEQGGEPRILIYISAGQDDMQIFETHVKNKFIDTDLVAHCSIGVQLREVVAEYQALIKIENSYKALHTDPIAKKEFEERLSVVEFYKDEIINSIVDRPSLSNWYFKGHKHVVTTNRDLQRLMSDALHNIYNKSPIIQNELINRDRPSAQAVAARNKLLVAMLENEAEFDLGIAKYPPEKSIYKSLIQAAGFHQKKNGNEYQFVNPDIDSKNKLNFNPVWKLLTTFLESTEERPKSFVELNEKLMSPPYGVKAGVLPVLYLLCYLINRKEIAVYEGRVYKPRFDAELLERFNKRPDEFYFQLFRISGVKSNLFDQYANVILGEQNKENKTLIELVEPLASFMGRLPEYTKKTRQGLSEHTKALRKAFDLAQSPEMLLFEDIPVALGYKKFRELKKPEDLLGYSEKLKESLRELNRAYEKLLTEQRSSMAIYLCESPDISLDILRKRLRKRFAGLERYSIDTQGVKGLLIRIANDKIESNEWFENILIFLSKKASKKWNDQDRDQAGIRLRELASNILDLEKIKLESGLADNDAHNTYLLRSVKYDGTIYNEVVRVDHGRASIVSEHASKLLEQLRRNKDFNEQAEILAVAVDKFLELKSKL